MEELENALILRENAKNQLQQIRDVETGVSYLNKIKSIEVWIRAERKDSELQNLVSEQKLRTQRILGKLIKDKQAEGTIASQYKGGANIPNGVSEKDTVKTLSELGLSRNQSSAFQKIAEIPEEIFEKVIIEKKDKSNSKVSELSTAGMIKIANEINKKNDNTKKEIDIDEEIESKFREFLASFPTVLESKHRDMIQNFIERLNLYL